MFGVCVCVCVFVCCGTLKKCGKTRIWFQKRLRVKIQNVPVCTGTTRTCRNTCARGARINGDVLNVHTGTFWTHGGEGQGSSSVLLTKICPHGVITCLRGSPNERNP